MSDWLDPPSSVGLGSGGRGGPGWLPRKKSGFGLVTRPPALIGAEGAGEDESMSVASRTAVGTRWRRMPADEDSTGDDELDELELAPHGVGRAFSGETWLMEANMGDDAAGIGRGMTGIG